MADTVPTSENNQQTPATQNKPLPINFRLRDLSLKQGCEFEPRRYQIELYEKALEKNVIIFLGTGLGKTFITVLYLNSAYISEQINRHVKRVVFMAPTQDLVQQQADYINKQVLYRAKVYCGRTCQCGEHIDHWNKSTWDAELDKIQILFMTPQIFASAISTGLLEWNKFCTVIFDECHHGYKNKSKESGHPYAQIMNHYHSYFSMRSYEPRPRIICLTASLINSYPKLSNDILVQISRIEKVYASTCVSDYEAQEAKPKMVISDYNSLPIDENNDHLLRVLTKLEKDIDLVLKPIKQLDASKYELSAQDENTLAFHKRLKLASMGFGVSLPKIGKVMKILILMRKQLGLWALRETCQHIMRSIERPDAQFRISDSTKSIYGDFYAILRIINDGVDIYLEREGHQESLMSSTRSQPKALLKILMDEYKKVQESKDDGSTFSCLVFAKTRFEVLYLCKWLQAVSKAYPEYSFIKPQYAVGLAAVKGTFAKLTKSSITEQTKKLNDFRRGELNVIVTTPVLEEGIDLPVCSTVIRYAEAKTYREYVQSRGRARQIKSSYITMCESDKKLATHGNLLRFDDFELALRNALTTYNIGPEQRRKYAAASRAAGKTESARELSEYEDDFFMTNKNTVRVSSSTAYVILHMYCQNLSKNRPFTEKIRFGRNQLGQDKYQTTLYLPSSCPISAKGIVGRIKISQELADSSAVVAALKALYDAKELDSNCVPLRFTETNIDNLLERHGLEPRYKQLDRFCEGIVIKQGDKDVSFYQPELFEPKNNCLARNFSQRTYKLIKIRFIPRAGSSRRDTERFFEDGIFGLIVDSSTSDEFIPSKLFHHYGEFVVQHGVVLDRLNLSSRDHNEYFRFTHKVLTRCLNIRGLRENDFRDNCLFYLVLLSRANHQPDIPRMKKAFYGNYNSIAVGDVVKLRSIYIDRRQNRSNVRDSQDGDRLMMVRSIHKNMGPRSIIPGCNVTFQQDAEYKFGPKVITSMNQPVYEVMPISKDFAQVQSGKRARSDYTTSSIYYLEQFLEYFHDEQSTVFQAFNMPEIIYSLYLLNNASELDRKFCYVTQERRQKILLPEHPQQIESDAGDVLELDTCPLRDNFESVNEPLSTDSRHTDSDHSDSEFDSDSDSSIDSNDLLDDQQAEEYARGVMATQNEEPYQRHLKNSLIKSNSVGTNIPYDFKTFDDSTRILEAMATVDLIFRDLMSAIDQPLNDLTRKLAAFKLDNLDLNLPDDEDELTKRSCRVDRSIVPPISLDRNAAPLRHNRSRAQSVLEALTLSQAQESYNLEELENVGDSYLKYVVSVVLYKKLTDVREGLMALSRSRLTCNKYFTHLAKRSKLGSYAITRGFSRDVFAQVLGRKIEGNFERKKNLSLSKMRPKDLADVFESIVGSYLLYHGEYEAILALEWLELNLFQDQDIFTELHEDAVVFSKVPSPSSEFEDFKELSRQYESRIDKFQTVLGYTFNDPSFLIQAFTHLTYKSNCTPSYERLEFLGDAILDYLVTRTLLASHPERKHWTPGQLTSSRSALVNNTAFARLAVKYGFDLYVLHESAEVHAELAKMRLASDEEQDLGFFDMVEFDSVVKLLGDVFESVAGAIYLDSGCSLDTVWGVYYPIMKNSIEEEIKSPTKNPISILYETYTGKDRIKYEKEHIKEASSSLVRVKLFIGGFQKPFEGIGLNMRQAKMRAVINALDVSREDQERCQEDYRRKNPEFRPRTNNRPILRRDMRIFRRHNVSKRR